MDTNMIGPAGPNPVAEEQFRKGFELAKSGNIEDATLAVEAAIAITDDDSRYHDLLGTLYAKRGLYEMAVAEWRRSIECDPDHAEVFRRIETAEKLRAQPKGGGHRWNHVALITLAVCFAAASAAATYVYRNSAADASQVIALTGEIAQLKKTSVSQEDHQKVVDEVARLTTEMQKSADSSRSLAKQLEEYRNTSVPKADYDRLVELKETVTTEQSALRIANASLTAQLNAFRNADGNLPMQDLVAEKEAVIKRLEEQYAALNTDWKKVDAKLKEKSKQTADQAVQIENLKKQISTQTAQAPAVGSGTGLPDQDVLFLLNGTLDAVRYAVEGKKSEALAQLKKVQPKAPQGAAFETAIQSLDGQPAEQAPPEPPAADAPAPTATPKPAAEKPTPAPTKKPAEKPAPTRPKPTPKPKATATQAPPSPPVASGDGPAVPRPVKRLDSGASTPPRPAASAEDRKAQLFNAKKQLHARALSLYQARKFREAAGVIDRAYRIDPTDPAVNQLRDAIRSNL